MEGLSDEGDSDHGSDWWAGSEGSPVKELQQLLGLLYPCDGVVGPGVISADVGAQKPEV